MSDIAPSPYAWLRQSIPLGPTDTGPERAAALRETYASAEPFPHIVLDGLFDDAMLDQALAAFPEPDGPYWHRFDSDRERKLALDREDLVPMPIRMLLYTLNGASFLDFLERATGIEGLIPDPHWDGGGLHRIERGGKLAIHADFNRHNRTGLDRRLNLLLYLHKDWLPEYGGDLELWDRPMRTRVRKIAPLFNRTVVFSTTDTSWHGHPEPLACPPDRARRSLALYYYTNGRPEGEISAAHSTIYRNRPGERLLVGWRRKLRPRWWK